MLVVSSREFRDNQKKYFDSVDNGEHWNRLESSVLTENIFEIELKENSITTFVIR